MVSTVAFQYMILALVLAVGLEILTLGVVFGTGIGKRVMQRIKQRWRYKTGRFVNTIFLRRNHVSHELFVKKENDGSIVIENQKYSVNPMATFMHDGIPTQINKEGDAEAFNIFNHPEARSMSTAELENIIMNNEVNDLAAAIKKLLPFILIGLFIFTAFVGASLYFNFKIYDSIVSKHILDTAVSAAQATTAVVPR